MSSWLFMLFIFVVDDRADHRRPVDGDVPLHVEVLLSGGATY